MLLLLTTSPPVVPVVVDDDDDDDDDDIDSDGNKLGTPVKLCFILKGFVMSFLTSVFSFLNSVFYWFCYCTKATFSRIFKVLIMGGVCGLHWCWSHRGIIILVSETWEMKKNAMCTGLSLTAGRINRLLGSFVPGTFVIYLYF